MPVSVTQLGHSRVALAGELPAEELMREWEPALAELGNEVSIEGFRKGHVPETILVQKLGEERVLLRAAERALAKAYPALLREHAIDAIGRPQLSITKLARNNPLGFHIETAVTPQVTLPDYKGIAKKTRETFSAPEPVTNEEVERALTELKQQRTPEGAAAPALDDAFAKSVGNFENLAALRETIHKNLEAEAESRFHDKRRLAIIDALRSATTLEIPDLLIDAEREKMLAELRAQIEGMGLQFNDYLAHLKKSEAELSEGWRADATRRVESGLILNAISEAEKLLPSDEELAHEVEHMQKHYPDADPERLRHYLRGVLGNEKVFKFLETC